MADSRGVVMSTAKLGDNHLLVSKDSQSPQQKCLCSKIGQFLNTLASVQNPDPISSCPCSVFKAHGWPAIA